LTFFLSAFFFPVAALIVLFGLGLLTSAIADHRVRPELMAPLGLGALIVLGQFTTWVGIGTPTNVILMVVFAAIGYVLLARKRTAFFPDGGSPREWVWWIAPGVLAGGILLATIIFLGHASLAGFLVDTTSSVQMLGGDWALHGSADFASAGQATAGNALIFNYFSATAYPYGSQLAYALLGSLSGTGLIWLYTPYMALMLALSGFGMFRVARLLDMARGWSALAAFCAAVPALVYAHAVQGAIKEITFIPLLIVFSLLLLDPLLRSKLRSIAVLGAVLATALIGAIGLAALAWIAPLGVAAVIAQTKRFGGDWSLKAAVIALASTIVGFVLLMIPKISDIVTSYHLVTNLSDKNAKLASDPGNLNAPIHKLQAFGVWLGGNHRVPPLFEPETWLLIGFVVLAFVVGLYAIVRARKWAAVAWIVISTVIWYVLTSRGTIWLDSKLVLIASHMVMVIAVLGASQLKWARLGRFDWLKTDRARKLAVGSPAYALAAVILFGVLASDGLQYLATDMMPADRYQELQSIDDQYAGKGPAYMPDFDENALYTVRGIGAVGPGNAFTAAQYVTFRNGVPVGYGHSSDIDKIIGRSYQDFPLVIQRRGPIRSRPGADYDLVRQGDFYDVFKKNDVKVVAHEPAGTHDAVGAPNCKAVKKLAADAEKDPSVKLVAALPTAPLQFIDNLQPQFIGPIGTQARDGGISGAGDVVYTATVKPGQQLWWLGTMTRPMTVYVDGKKIGRFKYALSGHESIAGPVALPPGKHKIVITRGGGRPVPGGRSGAFLYGQYLASGEPSKIKEIQPADAESALCGQQVDWVELIKR
jgi:hypothetical protein